METIMLITESPGLLTQFKQIISNAFPKSLIKNQGDSSGFVVQNAGSDRLYFDYCGTDLASIGWEGAEIARIFQQFPKGYFIYSIQYRAIDTVKKILVRIANSDQMMVDNDFGAFIKGDDFVAEIINNPTWDWLKDSCDESKKSKF